MTSQERAKEIIRGIVLEAGGSLRKRTSLYKAFYLAHLFFYRDHSKLLSDWPVVRMPKGPGIDRGRFLTQQLVQLGKIKIALAPIGPYQEEVFTAIDDAPGSLSDDERKAVREAVEFVTDKSAAELSELLHEYSRAWQNAADGDELNIYLDLIPDDEYEAMAERLGRIDADVKAVFG